jgi:hypothetical protein
MKLSDYAKITLALGFALCCGVSCNRSSAPPAPLPPEQLAAAVEKAFAKAKPETKELANQAVAAFQAQDYPKAYAGLQNLASKPGLSKEQTRVTASGLLTVNGLLQAAQAAGDAKAAETIKYHRANK